MKKQEQDIKANVMVYQHRRVSDGEIFYIGIGAKNRPYSKYNRNNYWLNYTNKYDYVVDILSKDLTWEEACIKEKSLILEYGRHDLKQGTLVNMTDGGDGQCNLAQESRDKISLANKGKTTWMKGKKHTEEAKKKNSEKHLGKVPSNKGKPSPYRGISRPDHSARMVGVGNSNAKRVLDLTTLQTYTCMLNYMNSNSITNYYQFQKLIKNNKIKVI